MRCQNDGAGLVLHDLANDRLHEAASCRVHASRRLIEQDDWWTANQSLSHANFPLVTAREITRRFLPRVLETELDDSLLDGEAPDLARDSLELCVILDVLLDCHRVHDEVRLRAVANQLASLLKVS